MTQSAKFDKVYESTNNIAWAYGSFLATKILNLVALVILARYLVPTDFGLMAICFATMAYFEIMTQFGMGAALISVRDDVEETASTVLVLGLVLSVVFISVIWSVSVPIANWYGDTRLADILRVMSFGLLVRAGATVNTSLLFRDLRLKAKLLPDIARGLTKGSVGIVLVVFDYGIWSLVIGFVAGDLIGCIVTWIARPWRPTKWPKATSAKYVIRFGMFLICSQLMDSTTRVLDNLLVGKFLGTSALGLYSIAFRIPQMGVGNFSRVASTVFHPIMSKLRDNPAELREYYYNTLKYTALLMFGSGTAIAVLSRPLIQVLYNPEWYGITVPMQFLAISFAVGTINLVSSGLYKALGRTDFKLIISLINFPFFVILIWLAVPYGIEAVAFAQFVLAFIRLVPNHFILRRAIGVSTRDTLKALRPAFLCALAATLAALSVSNADLPNAGMQLLGASLMFASVYLLVIRLMLPEVFSKISQGFLRKRSRV